MAKKLPRPCRNRRCPNTVTHASGYCPEHRSEKWSGDDRPSFRERGYDARWSRVSRRYRAKHPICEVCGEAASEETHHVEPVKDGGKMYAFSNLLACCKPCHARVEP